MPRWSLLVQSAPCEQEGVARRMLAALCDCLDEAPWPVKVGCARAELAEMPCDEHGDAPRRRQRALRIAHCCAFIRRARRQTGRAPPGGLPRVRGHARAKNLTRPDHTGKAASPTADTDSETAKFTKNGRFTGGAHPNRRQPAPTISSSHSRRDGEGDHLTHPKLVELREERVHRKRTRLS